MNIELVIRVENKSFAFTRSIVPDLSLSALFHPDQPQVSRVDIVSNKMTRVSLSVEKIGFLNYNPDMWEVMAEVNMGFWCEPLGGIEHKYLY